MSFSNLQSILTNEVFLYSETDEENNEKYNTDSQEREYFRKTFIPATDSNMYVLKTHRKHKIKKYIKKNKTSDLIVETLRILPEIFKLDQTKGRYKTGKETGKEIIGSALGVSAGVIDKMLGNAQDVLETNPVTAIVTLYPFYKALKGVGTFNVFSDLYEKAMKSVVESHPAVAGRAGSRTGRPDQGPAGRNRETRPGMRHAARNAGREGEGSDGGLTADPA
jgi:hypothetical protein